MSSSDTFSSIRFVRIRRRLRPLFLLGLSVGIFGLTVRLFPSRLEQPSLEKRKMIDPESLIDKNSQTLATGIPVHKISEYTVDQFQYLSTKGTTKLWKIIADKAYLYQTERLVHTRTVTAHLFDEKGQITVVKSLEGKYFMNDRDLELFGKIQATFPDGFELNTEYLKYEPQHGRIIIPTSFWVRGKSAPNSSERIRFESRGMTYLLNKGEIKLPSSVRVEDLENPTTIDSDEAILYRDKRRAAFSMASPKKALPASETPFVHIDQPTLFARSRRAELKYSDHKNTLHYMNLFEDVLIKEKVAAPHSETEPPKITRAALAKRKKKEPSLRYATAGRADFDAKKNTILLTEFPQAYQDDDTVTGEVMIFHRNTDLIEIEQSNAINTGD